MSGDPGADKRERFYAIVDGKVVDYDFAIDSSALIAKYTSLYGEWHMGCRWDVIDEDIGWLIYKGEVDRQSYDDFWRNHNHE